MSEPYEDDTGNGASSVGFARYYGLDFCPAFWDWLDKSHAAASVFSIEKVGDEIAAGQDDLAVGALGQAAGNLRMVETSSVSPTLDPEGAHLAALRRVADLRGARVLEMGCGDGRLTGGIAEEAEHVLAFDPDAEAVEQARKALPFELCDRVSFRVASAEQLEIAPGSFDLVVFSWSL